MTNDGVKRISVGVIIVLISIAAVALIVVSLLSVWKAKKSPIVYVITGVENNRGIMLPECTQPTITIMRDVITDQLVYKCGELGNVSEVVTLYK